MDKRFSVVFFGGVFFVLGIAQLWLAGGIKRPQSDRCRALPENTNKLK